MKKFKLIVLLVILLIIAVFLLQNLSRTDLIFVVWTFEISKAYIILGSIVIGFLIGAVSMLALRKKI